MEGFTVSTVGQILERTAHRPWPLPERPWRWLQGWKDLLFCHWAMPPEALRPHLPSRLEIDTKDGTAWVSAVAFHMARVRPRWLPPFRPVSDFLELNLRTYVRLDDRPGVFFLSIHAGKRLAVRVARWLSPLPYSYARMQWSRHQQEHRFLCSGQPEPIFDARYTTTSQSFVADQGSLDEWLLERYCLYLGDPNGGLVSAEIHHEPWSVKKVDAEISSNRLGRPFGIALSSSPDRAHFSPGVEALAWPFEQLDVKQLLVGSC
jgi:uncharacterized protein YqjF (DUF2071 family)